MSINAYSVKRFDVPSSLVGKGNFLPNLLTRWFSLNPTITVVSAAVNHREGRSRSDTFYFTLLYRGGGSPGRMWASQFNAVAGRTCEQQAQDFVDANPGYVPVLTVILSRPDTQPRVRRLLVIYATAQNVQAPCLLNAPVGVPADDVLEAEYGTFYDDLDTARPGLPGLNLGNAPWPDGGANLLVRALGSDPAICAWGGIAPCCYEGEPFEAPATPTATLFCDLCINPDEVTISYTTETTSTSSSTSTTSTSTTSTTTTSTSTTTTTSTSTTSTSTLSTTSTSTTTVTTVTTTSTTTTTLTTTTTTTTTVTTTSTTTTTVTTTSTTTTTTTATTTTSIYPGTCCLWYLESNWICDESPHWATFVVFKIFGPVPCGPNNPWPMDAGNSDTMAFYHPLCDDTPENRATIAAAAGVPGYDGTCG